MSETPIDMGFTDALAGPSPAPSPAPAPSQTPFERDTARVSYDRAAIERERSNAVGRRTGAEVAPQTGDRAPSAEPPASEPSQFRARPSWCPDTAWDARSSTIDHAAMDRHYRETIAPRLAAHDAWEASRAALPAPEDYKVATTETFKAPEGVDYKVDGRDPWWNEVKAVAHKLGLSQEAFSGAVYLISAREVQGLHYVDAARNAELAKLGPNGQGRADAVATWLENAVGDDAAALGMVMRRAPVARVVETFEKIIVKASSLGRSSGRSAGMGTPDGWDRMTFEQRRAFQEGHRP